MTIGIYTFFVVLVGWIFSLCLHEWAHAYVAYRGGDTTVKDKGYLDFNPLRYTDPFLSIILPMIFLMLGGLALPGGAVYIELQRIRSVWMQSLVSLAGPIANLLLAIVIGVIFRVAPPAADSQPALAFLGFLMVMAVLLNMLPIPGLDGFGVIRPFLPENVQRASYGFSGFGFILVFVLLQIPQFKLMFWSAVYLGCVIFGIPIKAAMQGNELFTFWN